MLVFRVCNSIEAGYQRAGEIWQRPPVELKKLYHGDRDVVYASLFPEFWRRTFNDAWSRTGWEDTSDHTLLLDVPDDVEERRVHRYLGMEYIVPTTQAMVRGIAGPEWPVPDWLPAPPDSNQWNPRSCDWNNLYIWLWKPSNGRKIARVYRQSQEERRAERGEFFGNFVRKTVLNVNAAPVDRQPVREQDLYAPDDLVRLLGEKRPMRSLLEQYRPRPDWFANPRAVSGPHGIAHAARVLILQELLSRITLLEGFQDKVALSQEGLRWAAVTHDTQRRDDGRDDMEHGKRAAIWAEDYLWERYQRGEISHLDMMEMEYVNIWHVPDDVDAPVRNLTYCIFKDADALDRVRFAGNLISGYFRTYPTRCLVPLATRLYQLSEQKRLAGRGQFDAVLDAAVELQMVLDE